MRVMQSFFRDFFGNFFLDIYFCPFFKKTKNSLENVSTLTIIEIYRLVAKKINKNLL